MKLNSFYKRLISTKIPVHHDSIEDFIFIDLKVGVYNLIFKLTYDIIEDYFIDKTNELPKENGVTFVNKHISEIEIIKRGECMDISDSQLSAIEDILYSKLIH